MLPDDISLTQQQVRAAQGGDREALEALFARYLPRVRRLAASRLGRTTRDFADVEDLVQETLKDAAARGKIDVIAASHVSCRKR